VPHCMGLQCIWTVGSSRCCKANRETCCLATAGGKTIIMYMGCMGDSRCRPGSSTYLFAECMLAYLTVHIQEFSGSKLVDVSAGLRHSTAVTGMI